MGRGPKWDSQDLPAFILACQVLNATEGHLWNGKEAIFHSVLF